MPTYQNDSQHKRTVGADVIESGKKLELLTYHNLRGLDGVKIVDDFPYYSPILISSKITSSEEIAIPRFDSFGNFIDKFTIHMYVELGEVTINFNTSVNKVPLKLYNGCKWNIRSIQRLIDKLYITSEKPFVMWLIVEKI